MKRFKLIQAAMVGIYSGQSVVEAETLYLCLVPPNINYSYKTSRHNMNELAIICVDDDTAILRSLEMEIKNIFGNSYIIELAENGNDAIEICNELLKAKIAVVLVISDYIMPDMKGNKFLQHIHQLSPKTVKILLTGQADLESIGKAMRHENLYRYIAKPWQVEELQLTLINALHSYNQDTKLIDFNNDLETRAEKLMQEIQETNQVVLELNQDKDKVLSLFSE